MTKQKKEILLNLFLQSFNSLPTTKSQIKISNKIDKLEKPFVKTLSEEQAKEYQKITNLYMVDVIIEEKELLKFIYQ